MAESFQPAARLPRHLHDAHPPAENTAVPSPSFANRETVMGEWFPFIVGMFPDVRPDAQGGTEADVAAGTRGGIVSQVQDSWKAVVWCGEEFSGALELAGDAIESNDVVIQDAWAAAKLPGPGNEAVVVALPAGRSERLGRDRGPIDGLAQAVGRAWQRLEQQRQDSWRLWQVTTMLREAVAWQRMDDDEELLSAIARCSCEVVRCQRATIFLWDKRRSRLIGRPAIGVPGGVLEVEDDAGIVGEVLQSGAPKWWSAGGIDADRVNRRIDESQNFQTRSLLAVPMWDARGQVIGVFEAINAVAGPHRLETFDSDDVWALTELSHHAAAAIQAQRTRQQLTRTRDRLVETAAAAHPLIGEHPAIREVRENASKLAPTDLSVLVLGRNGTGKEVLAQHIHYQSSRRNGPFIAVNCAALVESLLESELFGHEKGAFTDASSTRVGKFELASGGTFFLDEVGDLSPGGQAKLLRVLEEKTVIRVGGSQPIPVDVRVIAATNQPLDEMIREKRFREDLFFRLNVVSLTLPPLSRRGEDVLLLAEHFLQHFCSQIGRSVPRLDDRARQALLEHPWPGNIRELRNTIERVCYLAPAPVLSASHLMLSGLDDSSDRRTTGTVDSTTVAANRSPVLADATRDFQIRHIQTTIQQCSGNMTHAASTLGLHRSNLYRKMRQLGMPNAGEDDAPELSEPRND